MDTWTSQDKVGTFPLSPVPSIQAAKGLFQEVFLKSLALSSAGARRMSNYPAGAESRARGCDHPVREPRLFPNIIPGTRGTARKEPLGVRLPPNPDSRGSQPPAPRRQHLERGSLPGTGVGADVPRVLGEGAAQPGPTAPWSTSHRSLLSLILKSPS